MTTKRPLADGACNAGTATGWLVTARPAGTPSHLLLRMPKFAECPEKCQVIRRIGDDLRALTVMAIEHRSGVYRLRRI